MGDKERAAQAGDTAGTGDVPPLTVVLAAPRSFCAGVVPVGVRERVTATEDGTFALPKQVRRRPGTPEDAPAS